MAGSYHAMTLVALLAITATASAADITWQFGGTLHHFVIPGLPLGAPFENAQEGDPFTLTYTYDSETPDGDPGPGFGLYDDAIFTFELTIGDATLSEDLTPPDEIGQISVSVDNDWIFTAIGIENVIILLGPTQLEAGTITSDELPLTIDADKIVPYSPNPDSGSFFGLGTYGAGGVATLDIQTFVPEPTTLILLGLAGALIRRR